MGLMLNAQNETTVEQRNRETKRSCIDVTALLSSFSRLARFFRQSEEKFDAFISLKYREEKLIGNFFFKFHTRTTLTFDQANKKFCHIHF